MIRSDQQSQNMSKMSELQNGSCKLVFDNLTAVWLYRYISGCTAAHDRDEIFRKKYSGLYKSRPRLAKERLTIWKRKKQIFIQISQPKGFSEIFCVPHRSTNMSSSDLTPAGAVEPYQLVQLLNILEFEQWSPDTSTAVCIVAPTKISCTAVRVLRTTRSQVFF